MLGHLNRLHSLSYKLFSIRVRISKQGRVAQSVGHLTRKSRVQGSIPGLATYFRFSFRFFKKGSCQLVVCFGFNGPLRQYFSLYRAFSQREGERGERTDESKNLQTTRTYCKCNRPLPYYNRNCRTPRHWAVVSYWRKYVHEVLVNRLGGLSLPRKSVIRLTDLRCLPWT